MITVEEATDIIMSTTKSFGVESVKLLDSIGRVLAEDVLADRDFPPFDRVMMDGVAISYQSYDDGQRSYIISGLAPAGEPVQTLSDTNTAIEVMTGAPLPIGADTVIRYEDLSISDSTMMINTAVQKGQSIHTKGRDQQKGDIILSKGHRIKAIDINVLATVGKTDVQVMKTPSIAIVSTGDELVPVSHTPEPHQIRRSNVSMLQARLIERGIVAIEYHISDTAAEIERSLTHIIADHDVVLLSGGVSMGKFDHVPTVLRQLGIEQLFHKVRQRPGKPMWFGQGKETTVFAFPGNPVSTLACFHKYFLPWLEGCTGQRSMVMRARLCEDVFFAPDLHYFAQCSVECDASGQLCATVSRGNGSGDMVHPTRMDGFIELPRGEDTFKAGASFPFIPFHPLVR